MVNYLLENTILVSRDEEHALDGHVGGSTVGHVTSGQDGHVGGGGEVGHVTTGQDGQVGGGGVVGHVTSGQDGHVVGGGEVGHVTTGQDGHVVGGGVVGQVTSGQVGGSEVAGHGAQVEVVVVRGVGVEAVVTKNETHRTLVTFKCFTVIKTNILSSINTRLHS